MSHAPYASRWSPATAVAWRASRSWRQWTCGLLCLVSLVGCSSISSNTQNHSAAGYATKKSSPESSGLGSLFHKEPESPKTVKQFMSLPRSDL